MDTRTCKYCGTEFKDKNDWDKTFNEGFCNKIHRKDWEHQKIKEGEIESIHEFVSGLNYCAGVMKDSKYRDSRGERIWFPSDEQPYYDTSLQKHFLSKKQKSAYMKENNICMDGSTDKDKLPIEAGDNRFKKVR